MPPVASFVEVEPSDLRGCRVGRLSRCLFGERIFGFALKKITSGS